jgi:hypothetical protein
MPAEHRTELLISDPSGNRLGSVVVKISEDQSRELEQSPPQSPYSGKNPKVDQAICDGVTKEEREKIAKHFGLESGTEITLRVRDGFLSSVDEANPDFEINGRTFWIPR